MAPLPVVGRQPFVLHGLESQVRIPYSRVGGHRLHGGFRPRARPSPNRNYFVGSGNHLYRTCDVAAWLGPQMGLDGIALAASGKEVLYAGAEPGNLAVLYAADLTGKVRLLQRFPEDYSLMDTDTAGNFLLSRGFFRGSTHYAAAGASVTLTAGQDLSWHGMMHSIQTVPIFFLDSGLIL